MTDGEVVMADYEPKLKKALPLKKNNRAEQ